MPDAQGNETQEELMERVKNMSPEELLEFQKSRCIFCQIMGGRVQSKKIYEDELVSAILDINPANPGHVLVMPKEHYSIMPQVPEEVLKHLFIVVKKLSQVALKSLGARGTNILVQNGVAAGQKSQHFMVHLIPRKENDGLPFKLEKQDITDTDYDTIKERMQKKVNEIFGIKEEAGAGVEEKKEEANPDVKPAEETKEEIKPTVESKEVEKPAEEKKEEVKPAEETKEEIKEAEFEEEKPGEEEKKVPEKEKVDLTEKNNEEEPEEINEANNEVKDLNKDIEELQSALGDEVDSDNDSEEDNENENNEEDIDNSEDTEDENIDDDDNDEDTKDNDDDTTEEDSEDNSEEEPDVNDENEPADNNKDDDGANLDDISKLFG